MTRNSAYQKEKINKNHIYTLRYEYFVAFPAAMVVRPKRQFDDEFISQRIFDDQYHSVKLVPHNSKIILLLM